MCRFGTHTHLQCPCLPWPSERSGRVCRTPPFKQEGLGDHVGLLIGWGAGCVAKLVRTL
jgi:hypothetical protein